MVSKDGVNGSFSGFSFWMKNRNLRLLVGKKRKMPTRYVILIVEFFYEKGVTMEVKSKIDEIIELTRINELLDKREAANAKKPSNVILWVLAVLGAASAVAIISFLVYRYMTPAFEDDYYDDDFDDFDDDFDDEDFIKE